MPFPPLKHPKVEEVVLFKVFPLQPSQKKSEYVTTVTICKVRSAMPPNTSEALLEHTHSL